MADVTQINLSEAKTVTDSIKKLAEDQQSNLQYFTRLVNQMQGNWSGKGYAEYAAMYAVHGPESAMVLDRVCTLNGEIIKLIAALEKADMDAAKEINRV